MVDRRKTADRRNKLPKGPLPLYYTRRIPDRRHEQDSLEEGAAAGTGGENKASLFEVGDRSDIG